MYEIIERNLNFIAWENFTEIEVYFRWISSLLQIFLFAYISTLTSYLFLPKKEKLFSSKTEEWTIRLASGMALNSFFISIIGLCNFLYYPVIISFWILSFLFLFLKRKESFAESLELFKHIFLKNKILWLVMLIISISALLPPRWFDETTYHLTYPLKWVKEGKIFADGTMRFPLYTFNFHSLHTIGIFLDNTSFNHLLTWLTACLASFGIIAFLNRLKVSKTLQYFAAIAFFFTPVVQQHITLGYNDVPLMCFMLFTVYAIILFRDNYKDKNIQITAALICAMFVGMKTSNSFFVPLILFLALYRKPIFKVKYFILIFCILGSLWYMRNIIVDGDPIPPALNIMLGKTDKFWSIEDYQFQIKDIQPAYSSRKDFWYKLPLDMLSDKEGNPLRYWALSAYALFFILSIILLFRKKNFLIKIPIIFTFYAFIIWLNLSTFTRYAHFIALASVSCALFFNYLIQKTQLEKQRKTIFTFLIASLMLIPFYSLINSYKNNLTYKIPLTRKEVRKFVGWGNPTVVEIADKIHKYGAKEKDRIYCLGMTQFKYYFVKNGYEVIGDGVNKYRFADLSKSYKNNKLEQFLTDAKIKFLLIDKGFSSLFPNHNKPPKYLEKLYLNDRYSLFRVKNK